MSHAGTDPGALAPPPEGGTPRGGRWGARRGRRGARGALVRSAAIPCALGVLALAAAQPAAGQERGGEGEADAPAAGGLAVPAEGRCAPFHLPADHWAARQARRFDRAGLLDRSHPGGFRSPEASEVARAFAAAAEGEEAPEALAERLAAEIRGLRSPCEVDAHQGPRLEWLEARVGAAGSRGVLAHGVGSHWSYDGPVELPDRAHPTLELRSAVTLLPRIGLAGRVRAEGSHVRADELYATSRVGAVDLWAGRRAPGYGQGVGGSLVLSGAVPLDGGGIRSNRGLELPWLLEHLGPVRFQTEVARMADQGDVGSPWFWASRVSAAPTDWLRVAANRGAFIGGEGGPSIGAKELFYIFWGSRPKSPQDGFDGSRSAVANQLAAVEVEVRRQVRSVPVAGYIEWGFEDSSGAWLRQPAIIAGVEAPVLGSAGGSVGFEVADFHTENQHGVWYRHWHFGGGWADGGRLLGHPLAGVGREVRVHGTHGFLGQRVRAGLDLFRRHRHASNSFSPAMEGVSHGFRLEATGGGARFGGSVGVELERGGPDDRTRAEGVAALRWYF